MNNNNNQLDVLLQGPMLTLSGALEKRETPIKRVVFKGTKLWANFRKEFRDEGRQRLMNMFKDQVSEKQLFEFLTQDKNRSTILPACIANEVADHLWKTKYRKLASVYHHARQRELREQLRLKAEEHRIQQAIYEETMSLNQREIDDYGLGDMDVDEENM